MLRCLLVLIFITLLYAWLAPSKTLRDSALQALDSSVLCGLGGLETQEMEAAEKGHGSAPTTTRDQLPDLHRIHVDETQTSHAFYINKKWPRGRGSDARCAKSFCKRIGKPTISSASSEAGATI